VLQPVSLELIRSLCPPAKEIGLVGGSLANFGAGAASIGGLAVVAA